MFNPLTPKETGINALSYTGAYAAGLPARTIRKQRRTATPGQEISARGAVSAGTYFVLHSIRDATEMPWSRLITKGLTKEILNIMIYKASIKIFGITNEFWFFNKVHFQNQILNPARRGG